MTTKVKAPIGYHFMVRENDNDFYLMKTHYKGYSSHTSGEYVSSLDISIEVKGQHIPDSTTQRTATATSSSGRSTTTRTISPVRSSSVRYTNTSSSSGSGSGGSSSGGY